PEDASALFAYTGDEAQRIASEQRQAQTQRDSLAREREARARELSKLNIRQPDRIAASVRLAITTPGKVTIQLSYVITNASWRPRYDARVDMAGGRVRLTQQALITQRTGEDWQAVTLSLSNAQPSTAVTLPDDLDPWYLEEQAPLPPQPVAVRAPARAHAAMAPMAAAGALSQSSPSHGLFRAMFGEAEQPGALDAEMDTVAAEAERTGVAMVFHLPGGVDIPSDGAPHTVGMGDNDLPCTLEYVAAPLITPGAQLRATTKNTTGRVLLAGELHIFHATNADEEYVGQTYMEQTAENAPLKLYLGADDNITVKRELIERDTDKGALLQGDLRRVTFGYRVTLANRTTAPQRVVLKDRLPVPKHERIKIRTLDVRPQPTDRTRLEQLTWDLQLAPGEERHVEWRFVVESPRTMVVVGLTS
ncbi:MAG TPA: DUF4139 domain-containing protein, partial [Ktedonobacterales bacterium]|nr:DUF4139 domain-containing protein [Ktedonobacterales bacterium]